LCESQDEEPCEVICVKENVELLDMKDMEPALDVPGMKIMFGDEVVRKKINK